MLLSLLLVEIGKRTIGCNRDKVSRDKRYRLYLVFTNGPGVFSPGLALPFPRLQAGTSTGVAVSTSKGSSHLAMEAARFGLQGL